MKIWCYAVCWNEEEMLPFFLRHYSRFCEKIVLVDDFSDDRSVEIAEACPVVEVRKTDGKGEYHEDTLLHVKQHFWKEARGKADWVICCDVDEMLYHEDIIGFLAKCKHDGVTMPVPVGCNLVSEEMPSAGLIHDTVKVGVVNESFSKPCVFDPSQVSEIRYKPGCHFASPVGNIVAKRFDELKLLHAKVVGKDRYLKRQKELSQRRGAAAKRYGHAKHWDFDPVGVFNDVYGNAVRLL